MLRRAPPSQVITQPRLNDQTTHIEFTGRMSRAEITQKAAIDSTKLQAISTIISRMGKQDCPGY
jgi:hypothetical protein